MVLFARGSTHHLLLLVGFAAVADAFYLPGVAPHEFQEGDKIEVKVTKLSSVRTHMPYEFYSLPFCKPESAESFAENLGEVLQGDRILSSAYELKMDIEQSCKVLCQKTFTEEEMKKMAHFVEDDYYINWMVDNLPVARKMYTQVGDTKVTRYERGFPLGFTEGEDAASSKSSKSGKSHFINNHVRFNIKYNKDPKSFIGARIVGFEVEPFSVAHACKDGPCKNPVDPARLRTCTPTNPVSHEHPPMSVDGKGGEIIFTYDVTFEPSDVKWAARWDLYLTMGDDQIHWFSIINSVMIVLFLSGMVAMIMLRTLRRDFVRFNELETEEEMQEETGWKYVHTDVFRPPDYQVLFSVFVGSGVQVLGMTITLMSFAVLGFLSPANRGGLTTAMLVLFVFMGLFGGYYASRVYKMFIHQEFQFYKEPPQDSLHWKKMTFLTACLVPGIVFGVFFVMDMVLWAHQSAGAVPFGTMIALMALWFGVSVPLVFVGSYFGFKASPIEAPVKTNLIPRGIPPQPWYMNPIFSMLLGGVLPFGAVFIELFFIMSSLWLNHYYYVFGFLLVVLFILFITCSEITIVLTYFQLCGEDYHWWWRSFITAGSSAFYLFLYSILYFQTKLDIVKFVPAMLYFSYMAIVCVLFFMLTGTVGFVATLFFVRAIYAAVKAD